jgi:hypothetical protein
LPEAVPHVQSVPFNCVATACDPPANATVAHFGSKSKAGTGTGVGVPDPFAIPVKSPNEYNTPVFETMNPPFAVFDVAISFKFDPSIRG